MESVPDRPEIAYLAKLLSDNFRLVDRGHDHRRGIWNDPVCLVCQHIYIYDLVPKGVHENRTKGVENKVDDTLKLVVFLECAQC